LTSIDKNLINVKESNGTYEHNKGVKQRKEAREMKKTVIQLETVTCPSCIRRIEGTLNKQQGINMATVKFNASKVEVDHDESIITSDTLKSIISNLGYTVLNVK